MHGHFFEAFGKASNESRTIPEDILQELNKKLPANFIYVKRDDGNYEAVPNPKSPLQEMVFNVEFDLEKDPGLKKLYSELGPEKFAEYLFRSQRVVPTKNIKIGSPEKLESIGRLAADPFSDEECEITDSMIFPSRFEKPYKVHFESPEGDVAEIDIQQVKYDSLTEIKRENTSFPALKIEIYQYSPLIPEDDSNAHTNIDNQVRINYAVTPSKAKTVREAVVALHIFRGLLDGTTKINGGTLSSQNEHLTSRPVQLDSSLAFWETALKLEEKLNVVFDPSVELSNENLRLFTELDVCMLQGKTIEWKHPFDHFHIGSYHAVADEHSIEDYIGSGKISYVFIEGPIFESLLGAELTIYSRTIMNGFVITNIEWEENREGEVYIADADDNPWILSRHYCTEQEAIDFRNSIDKAIQSSS